MNNKALKNLRDLINNIEAVHNKYVDDKVSEVSELISKNDTGIVSLNFGGAYFTPHALANATTVISSGPSFST